MAAALQKKSLQKCMDCACLHLRMASRSITQYFEEELRTTGLHITQFNLLVGVAANEPVNMTDLAEAMGMDRTTLTRNLNHLTRAKMVKVAKGEDLRTRNITITAKGTSTLRKAMPKWQRAQDRVIKKFGRTRWKSLQAELGALREKASAY